MHDASVVVDALVVVGPVGDAARDALAGVRVLQAPDILLAEVVSGIRGLLLGGHVSSGRAQAALSQATSLRVESFPLPPFLDRVWELRDNVTVYDAWYVAVAERLETDLVTADRRLAAATGPRCPVRDVRSGMSGQGHRKRADQRPHPSRPLPRSRCDLAAPM